MPNVGNPCHLRTSAMSEPEFHCTWDEQNFRMWFLAPRQLLLNPDWEQLVWDETIRQAHTLGVIPVGSVFIRAEEAESVQQLVEGRPMIVGSGVIVDMVKIHSEVMVGAALL